MFGDFYPLKDYPFMVRLRRWSAIMVFALSLVSVSPVAGEEKPVPKTTEMIRIFDAQSGTYKMVEKIVRSDKEWKKLLTKEQFRVMRQHGTEKPFCELPNKKIKKGIYKCIGCGTDLFLIDNKFESGTGWPSFVEPIDEANVATSADNSLGVSRVEVHCARCGSHLGHVFDDGPPPKHLRYCINSVALRFAPKE